MPSLNQILQRKKAAQVQQERIANEEQYHEKVKDFVTQDDKNDKPINQPVAPKSIIKNKIPVKKSLNQLLKEGREKKTAILQPEKTEPKRGLLYGTGFTKKLAQKEARKFNFKPAVKTKEEVLKLIEQKQNEALLKEQASIPVVKVPISVDEQTEDALEGQDALVYKEPEITLDEYQERALNGILKEKYSVLIGAAGTGKTTLEKIIVRELEKSLAKIDINLMKKRDEFTVEQVEEDWRAPMCFCSFTGRAVQMMKKVLPSEYHPLCNTIHATLGYHPVFYEDRDSKTGIEKRKMRFEPAFGKWRKLPYRVYIIDEAGTCPIYLWNQLFDAMEPDSRVILVGDINQIPPVQGRSVLGFAMVNWPTFALEKIHRQAEGNPIIENAHAILSGQIPKKVPGQFDIVKLPGGSVATKETIIGYVKQMNELGIFHPFRDSLIVAQNSGGFGQKDLNEILAPYFNQNKQRTVIKTGNGMAMYAEGDKVMLLANDRQRGLTNGMTGKIVSINLNGAYRGQEHHVNVGASKNIEISLDNFAAHIESELDIKRKKNTEDEDETELDKNQRQSSHVTTVEFPGDVIIEFQTAGDYRLLSLGYAMTCHKMQGGECPTIAIAIHSANMRVLSREWLYTAVTRGSERVVLMCNDMGLSKALRTQKIKGKTIKEKIDVFVALEDQADTTKPNLPERKTL